MEVTKKSKWSGIVRTKHIDITYEQYMRWFNNGELIQNVMPELTDDEREFLVSGMTPEEWDEMCASVDDSIDTT